MIRSRNDKRSVNHKAILQIRDASVLSSLPDVSPIAIQELFQLIDCRTHTKYFELSEKLTPKLRAEISKSKLSFAQIAAMSNVRELDLNLICQRRLAPDLDRMERICRSLGGRLCLTIIDKNNVKLDCSNHLQSELHLEAFLSTNLHTLEIHPLAAAFFKRCGLRRAQGLHGGSLERRVPLLFRLMRISAFMRCTLQMSIDFIGEQMAAS